MSGVRWSGATGWYKVRYHDGRTEDVKVILPDVIRWETNNQGRSILQNQTMTSMLTVIFYALRREQLTDVAEFANWMTLVDDFAQLDEAPVLPDPTNPDQSDD